MALVDEAVDVWRPVRAQRVGDNLFRIADQAYDRSVEIWEFQPGDLVVCDLVETSEGKVLAAVQAASDRA